MPSGFWKHRRCFIGSKDDIDFSKMAGLSEVSRLTEDVYWEVDMKAEVVAPVMPVVPAALVVLAGATQVLDSEAATGGTTAIAVVRRRLEIPAGDKGYPLRALRCFSSFRTGTIVLS